MPKNYLIELSRYLTSSSSEADNRVGNGGTSSSGQVSAGAREELQGEPWFYGLISRAECDSLLGERGHDGDFLIRESETNVRTGKKNDREEGGNGQNGPWQFLAAPLQVGDFSISLKAPGRNKHFRIHVEGSQFCIGQRKFNSMQQLVEHYQRAPIYTSQKGEKLFLIRPLPK